MYYELYKEVPCPSNKKIDKSKFDLMIYVAVIHVVPGATHKFIYKILDMLNKIFHIKDVSIYTKHFEKEWGSPVLCFVIKVLIQIHTMFCGNVIYFQLKCAQVF